MPMKMGWRWYGEGNDPITLNDIKHASGKTFSQFAKQSFHCALPLTLSF